MAARRQPRRPPGLSAVRRQADVGSMLMQVNGGFVAGASMYRVRLQNRARVCGGRGLLDDSTQDGGPAGDSGPGENGLPAQDGRPLLLALRALKLGDMLVAVPALRALRRDFPEHRILYAAPAWIEEAVALVDPEIELFPTPGLDFPLAMAAGAVDVAVNLHGNGPESRQRIAELQARRVIAHSAPGIEGPAWQDGIHERMRWARLLQWHGIDADPLEYRLDPPAVESVRPGTTVIHVGAAYGSRLWPVERFAAVAADLAAAGHDVVLTGGGRERRRALDTAVRAGLDEAAVLAGHQGLRDFAAAIAHARLVISADTGAAHLASAYSRPSVVLFGPAPAEEWGPPPGPHIVLTNAKLRRGDVFAADPDPALLAVEVEDVLDAVAVLDQHR